MHIPVFAYRSCVGCGACVELYPENFMLEDGTIRIIHLKGLTETDCRVLEVICPASAITTEEI